jgi:hypothetical protein
MQNLYTTLLTHLEKKIYKLIILTTPDKFRETLLLNAPCPICLTVESKWTQIPRDKLALWIKGLFIQ